MATSNLKPYSPYESYNPQYGVGDAQHFGTFQYGPSNLTFSPVGTAWQWANGQPGGSGPVSYWDNAHARPGPLRPAGGGDTSGGLAGDQPQGGSLAGDIADVTSTIDYDQPLYTPEQTNAYTNQSVAKARQLGNPRQAMKGFSRPGMSHDEGTLAAALPQITRAQSEAQRLAGMLPLQDVFANEQFKLEGQQAAGQETSALARLLQQLQQTQDFERNSAMQAILNPMLGSVFG